jgi:hypothetical protein
MQIKINKLQKNLECPHGIPEDQCCGNLSCKTLIAGINVQKEAKR